MREGTSGGGRRWGELMGASCSLLLEKHLWPKGSRRDVWMILDGARDLRIFGLLLESHLEYVCLYGGFVPKALEAAAPYLVQLEFEDRGTRRLLDQAWGKSWGILLKCDTTLDTVRRHLRGFLMVRDPTGQRILFRYYDPRVFRVYLPSCSGEELRTVFGPVESFWVEDEKPKTVLRFELDGSRLVANALPLETPVVPRPAVAVNGNTSTPVRKRPGMLAIRRDQWSIFSQEEVQKFENWMMAHLHKFFRRQCAAMGESGVRELIQYGIRRAATYGITAKRDVCKYIDVMVVLGRDFDRDERYASWAPRILEQRSGSSAKAEMVLQSAIRQTRQSAVAQHA
ncbi:MAG TPA: DUF4123 domain-containing protein [Bryobacteraceae bacterium]|nr:DUF4123 domain-containing protein [Bryobacteraceae bacterium]